MYKLLKAFILIQLLLLLISCQQPAPGIEGVDNICGQNPCHIGPFDPPWLSGISQGTFDAVKLSGIQYFSRLSHDNRVYESANFLIFSDASDDWAKIRLSEIAEQVFTQLKQIFAVPNSDVLGIVDRDSKMTIYSGRHVTPMGFALRYGYLVPALDSPHLDQDRNGLLIEENYYSYILHESTHVMQFLLLGEAPLGAGSAVAVWFTEGIAEYISGGRPDTIFDPITSLAEFQQWFSPDEHVNPISIHFWHDFPVADNRTAEYYPMFGVAFRYLIEGLGKTYLDVKSMYRDIASSRNFRESFEKYMGISVVYFEENFYDLLYDFFQQLEEK